MNAIEIENLTKRYPGFTLDGLNLTLPGGCILGLIGENGAGKSTAIRLMLGMLRRDGGSVRLLGQPDGEANPTVKEQIGVVLDEVGFPECLSAEQIGKILSGVYRNWDGSVYADCLARFDLPLKKAFKDYSKGMKMKLGIATALSHGAKLLILDEATSGLDPVVRDELLDLLLDFTRDENHSVLISSHIVSDLERLCDYVAFLHKGKLLLCEEKDRLLSEYGMLRCPAERLATLAPEPSAILFRRESPYGVEALVKREKIPAGTQIDPVSIEELFVSIVKGGKSA